MDGDRKPFLTQPTSWQSATTQLLSHANYPFPSLKHEHIESNVFQASAQPDSLSTFSNELVPFQTEHFRNASSLEYAPCLDIYNPGASYSEEQGDVSVSDPVADQESNLHTLSRPMDSSRRILPAVGAFTVQCARCLKWRLIPTKEQYEAIRQCILEDPWVCENARIWRPNASCDDPADLSQDRSRLWAIDKPNISQPPPGWERLLVIRGEGASKFADVVYLRVLDITTCGVDARASLEAKRLVDVVSEG